MGDDMSKLNGGQRISLIFSVIAFFPLYPEISKHNSNKAYESKKIAFEHCMSAQAPIGTPIDENICLKESVALSKGSLFISIESIFTTLFILALFAGIFEAIGRLLEWVIEGFRKP
jgi:hypothetical protein